MKPNKWVLVGSVLMVLMGLWMPRDGGAAGPSWSSPVNLSRSSVAASPTLLSSEDGTLYSFWWDRFDGLTMAMRRGEEWQEPLPVPIVDSIFDADGTPRVNTQTEQYVTTTIRENGTIVADGAGGVNAFFLAQTDGSGAAALRRANADLADMTWGEATTVVFSVSAWRAAPGPDGALHLVVFYAGRSGDTRPGVYYLRSTDGGSTWSDLVQVSESLYVRRATPSTSHIDLTVGPTGSLYLAWNEPGTGRALWSWSADNGETWTEPQLVNPTDRAASYAQTAATSAGQVVMLWQGTGTGNEPALYSAYSPDGGYNWTRPQTDLSGLTGGSADLALLTAPDGRIVLVSGGQASGPALAMFDASLPTGSGQPTWSSPVHLAYPAASLGRLAAAGVERWQAVLLNDQLELAGVDEAGDIWALQGAVSQVDWANAGAAAWSDDVSAGSSAAAVLANAGSVTLPTVIAAANGARQAYWWDASEGLVSAYSDGSYWYNAQPAQAYANRDRATGTIPPFGAQIVGNGVTNGAFWIDAPFGADGALVFATQTPGRHAWSDPTTIGGTVSSFRAVASPDGRWSVLFSRVTEEGLQPAGMYYATLASGADGWTVAVLIAPLAITEGQSVRETQMDLSIVSDGTRAVWRDPAAAMVYYSGSSDGGASWSAPLAISEGDPGGERPRVAVTDDRVIVLYESPVEGGAELYQALLDTLGTPLGTRTALRGLPPATGPASNWNLIGQDSDRLLLTVVESAGEVSIAVWTGGGPENGWEPAQSLSLVAAATDMARFEPAALGTAHSGERLVVTSLGSSGQVGVLDVSPTELGWSNAGEGVWAWPRRVAAFEDDAGSPVMQADDQERLHVMWSAGGSSTPALWYTRYADGTWTQPVPVIQPQEGVACDPSLVAEGERLYAAWSGGDNGGVETAWSFATDAYAATSWPASQALPGPVSPRAAIGAHPMLTGDLGGALHAVYAVPINQYRGIYYTRSEDEGQTWLPATRLFDAAGGGWAMVDKPSLAADHDGTLYATWLRMDLAGGEGQARALYLARSRDRGQTWSEPRLVAEGSFGSPHLVVAAAGQPHLIWQDASDDRGVWDSWSVDSGETWSLPMRVRGFSSLSGEAGLASDGQGALYLAGVLRTADADSGFQLATWDGIAQQWLLDSAWALPRSVEQAKDLSLTLEPATGRLSALIVADILTVEGLEQALLYTDRLVTAREGTPEWTGGDARIAETPEARSTPSPSPTVRPTVDLSAPEPGGGAMEVGPLTVPILSIGGLLLVALLVAGVMIARGRRV